LSAEWIMGDEMPSAPDDLRDLMEKWFGDSIDMEGPLHFLRSHGFTEMANGMLRPPTPAHNCSVDEWNCIGFLVQEWDFGYLP
jgi:hypothetical protein